MRFELIHTIKPYIDIHIGCFHDAIPTMSEYRHELTLNIDVHINIQKMT